jgi:DNA replication and repair protein RecF
MALRRVQVTDFRCLHPADLEFDPRFTLISGPNASGKTSLLEAIYVLGRGRSFRTRRLDNLVQFGRDRFVVFGEVDTTGRSIPLGIEGAPKGTRARIDGSAATSLAELATLLPVQIIDPEVHRLIEEGPGRRRRFLDWGVFHVERSFIGHWQRYQQALRQRNAALKARLPAAVTRVWDTDLLRHGELLSAARALYVSLLAEKARAIGQSLLAMDLSLGYRPGWAKELTFQEALQRSWALDVGAGATQVGPQRGELTIKLNGMSVKDRISRGQQKLLAATLLMAQVQLFPSESAVQPSLLLDDPAAELDGGHLLALIQEVSSHAVQLIVTTLKDDFPAFGTPGRRYRIGGGVVTEA